MGADIIAYIVFDDNTPRDEEPFTNEPSMWSLAGDHGLAGCKDYRFIAAISGIRNETGKSPLIRLRGVPKSENPIIRELIGDPSVGWLTSSELSACLAHFGIEVNSLHSAVQNVLKVLEFLAAKYGDHRVRLIFSIED